METITQAAWQFRGQYYLGRRHCEIRDDIISQMGVTHVPFAGQGFWTSEERFVDRKEAAKIAVAAGQELKRPKAFNPNRLFSEDLW
jgi:hypothetical protein